MTRVVSRVKLLPLRVSEAETRDDLVRGTGEKREHPPRIGGVGRLPQPLAAAFHDGVDSEDRTSTAVDGARLTRGVLERVAAWRFVERR